MAIIIYVLQACPPALRRSGKSRSPDGFPLSGKIFSSGHEKRDQSVESSFIGSYLAGLG